MSRIYTYQTYLRIILTTGVDITNATTKEIFYKKPSGILGSVTATVQDNLTGIIYYDVEADSSGNSDFLDEAGAWKFWAYIEFADGRTARGETVTKMVYDYQDAC